MMRNVDKWTKLDPVLHMRIHFCHFALMICLSVPVAAQAPSPAFCAEAPHDRLCPVFPEDIPEFSEFFEYMVISAAAQAPFDRHAWQAFVALNWRELDPNGAPGGWWEFPRRDDVFGRASAAACDGQEAEIILTDLRQSDGQALVDRNGNYILYETRLNPVAAEYILETVLADLDGPVDFPRGRDAENPASVLVKTAWTVIETPSDDYVTASGLIVVPSEQSLSGEALCIEASLGMVGMHIVTKVESGNGDEWVWATFEHRANAPVAADARDINAIYGPDLFPQGCIAPDGVPAGLLLFDESLAEPANSAPVGQALWSHEPPYAVDAQGRARWASQVVRCWEIFGPTQATNARWQEALSGTVLENYMLISAQWRGANISSYLEHGELPRFLSNVTMETYLQIDRSGTCLGCHAGAATATGAPSDFTFLLSEVAE